MGLIDDALAESTGSRSICSVSLVLKEAPPALAAELVEAMAHPRVTSNGLSRILARDHGVKLSPGTLQRHRKGDCQCARDTKK